MLWLLYLVNCLFHYFFSPEVFSCSFNWKRFCLFVLFNFLCLCVFRWSSYLMWPWKGVPTQECPDTDCVCSCLWWESCIDMDASHIFSQGILVGITLAGGRAGDGVARAEPGVRWGFPTAQWPSLPFWGGVWSQAAEEEALRVEPTHGGSVPSKYMPSPFLARGPLPQMQERISKEAHTGYLLISATDRGLSTFWCNCPCGCPSCFSAFAQTEPWVQVPFAPCSQSLSPSSTTLALLWSHALRQVASRQL